MNQFDGKKLKQNFRSFDMQCKINRFEEGKNYDLKIFVNRTSSDQGKSVTVSCFI